MRKITLTPEEIEILDIQDPSTQSDGGFQNLMISLQDSLDRKTGDIVLSADHLERIPRYAFDYRNGGWQNRLVNIFGRSLGTNLGR